MLFFIEKGNLKFSESKMQCRKESEKLSLSENFQLLLNFQENNTEALVTSKRLKLPLDDRTDINFLAPLRIHF